MIKFPQAVHDFYASNGREWGTPNDEPSMTRQEFKEECDINSLMAKFDTAVIGGPGNLAPMVPQYVDFLDAPQDLLGYLTMMQEAEAAFMRLPAVVRREFDNSAVEFVAFASDPGNLDQMRSWGLAPPASAPVAPAGGVQPQSPAGASEAPAGAPTQLPT